ncbi:unique cartilage matrix-associated protein-like isoform X2 [Denticeps clupeoides]|uniref:unique cartilage matrix-associated protein-like isoform X3 n=1 Tax=Denticeps clupeoides TaxID=299321 RepID=UPI0010A40FFB|nr:unique cartilage matrix-associated protein-like isoform X3 [Denticeps clupeoides]XP_028823343.1 unique cartilage matrix-associated protein-like isoform X2 [Denticeps clupeoides]
MDSEISSLARVHANALLLSLTVKPRTGVFSKKVHGRFGRVSEKRVRPLPAVLAAPSRPCLHAPDSWWTMSWPQPLVLALLAVLVAVTSLHQADSAAASDDDTVNIKMALEEGGLRKIVMHEADASNFFRRRGRRSTKSQDELNAEQRLRLAADQRKRQYHEEQRKDFENFAEEEHDEQDERSRESGEQWTEFHHDGLGPAYD